MHGYIIFDEIITSRRFNRLLHHPLGEFSQIMYLLSYTKADFWGHLPFDFEWIKYQIFPGNDTRTFDDIKTAMCLLVVNRLWEQPYESGENLYIYIFNFDNMSKISIRKRMKGNWPAENGSIPRRDIKTPIESDIESSTIIRNHCEYLTLDLIPEYSGNFRNIMENYEVFRNIPSYSALKEKKRKEKNNKTGTANAGFFDSFPQVINISGKEIRKSYLIKLFHKCGDDLDQALRILFRAKDANDPIAYIEKGLSEGFAYEPVSMEYDNPAAVRAWIDTLCGIPPGTPANSKPKPNTSTEPSSIGDIIKSFSQ